ncbi:MAG: hypothetical protein L0Z53_12095 [Acidobacteriales bacterium]|nr:hypothetical protein [Terriglobales bacterium]
MNPILEQKMKELMDEAERQGAPAMRTVLHLLYASYLEGNQNRFARHCCRLTPVESIQVSVTDQERPEEWLTELDLEGNEEGLTDPGPRGYIN